jgi:hypothetical protein
MISISSFASLPVLWDMSLPMASLPRLNFLANVSFTIATFAAPARSARVNSRPPSSGTPIVEKYPGDVLAWPAVALRIAGGNWVIREILGDNRYSFGRFVCGAGKPGAIEELGVQVDATLRRTDERLTQRGSLFFDSVRIPARYRVGDESGGFYQAMVAFDFNRAIIGLACIGAAQQSLDDTIAYTKGRQVFGKPLAKFEGVAFQVAEYLTLLEAARLVSYKCLWLKDQGLKHTKEAAMAKWMGPKVSAEAIHACIILHGHYGYNMDSPLEQRWRDVVGLEIGDGTPEIMKGIVAREAFGREYTSYRD